MFPSMMASVDGMKRKQLFKVNVLIATLLNGGKFLWEKIAPHGANSFLSE